LKIVLHIVRKLLPSTASFIRNQIAHHNHYEAHIMYAEDLAGEMASEIKTSFPWYKAVKGRTGAWLYGRFRILTPEENRKAVRFIRQLQPDIIHVHYGVDMLTFSRILQKIDIPVIVSFYGYDCTSFPKRFGGLGKFLLQRKVFRHKNIKAVFAMSPDMKKDLLLAGCPENLIRIHYYGSECKVFNINREYKQAGIIRFTIISGLFAKKGHFFLLEAWKALSHDIHCPKINLTIIGSGVLKEQIQNRIIDYNLDNVYLKEPVKYGSAEHLLALQNTDVFVHPSLTTPDGDKEGIPGAIIEAMASGLPIISTSHAGIPSVIEHGSTGLLVEENNTKQLADAMFLLAVNKNLREKLGSNARKYANSTLDISIKEKELEKLYDEFI